MKVGILSSNNPSNSIESLEKSKLASNRLRLRLFKEAVIENNLTLLPLDFYERNEKADLIIIGKIVEKSGANIYLDDEGQRIDKWIKYISELKNEKSTIILDYTDNLIEATDKRADFYKKIINYVDISVVPSQQMKRNLEKYFKKKIVIIEEPLEEKVISFKNCNFDKIRALWFGHLSNINYLLKSLNKIEIDELVIVTSQLSETDKEIIKKINKNILCRFIIWEPNFYAKNKINCNVCLIPSDVKDLRKNGVSNNRLITAFALGLIPIASVIESYKDYSEYFLDFDKINNMINKNELMLIGEKLINNQNKILEKYSNENIKIKWLNLI
jgi:hypothetical protein